MRLAKAYIFSFFCAISISAMGQTIAIPDTSFSRCLKTAYPALFKNDQITVADAAKATGTLTCTTGNVQNAEGLQYFIGLTAVHLEDNELDTLPYMGNLTKLEGLFLMYNNLKYVPGVEKLSALQHFYCYKNQLKELPSLANLPNLVSIQAHQNQLTKLPELGAKPKLSIAYFNENQISTLSDLSGCTVVNTVRLYKNPLTFGELLKLPEAARKDSIFKLNPQQALNVGYVKEIYEGDSLVLSTGLDRTVAGVSYEWYKAEKLVGSSMYDSLVVAKASAGDTGAYTCLLKHPLFPLLVLKTSSFLVKVGSCLDLQQIVISSSEISCLNRGSLLVVSPNQKIKEFELLSTTSGAKLHSTDGKFSDLSDIQYTLYLTTPSGCRKQYPEPVVLNRKECEEVVLSPDNDGQGDSYYFKESGKVTIYDVRGHVVKSLSIPGTWDGTSDHGKVFSGFYVADINNGKKLMGITVLY